MEKPFKDQLKGTLIVPIGITTVLIPFSLLIGWNIFTLFLFWFVFVPTLTLYLPTTISKNSNHLFESLAGLTIFYGMMIFIIYDHYKTDYFQVMMVSCAINLVLITLITLVRRPRTLI